MTPAAFAGLVLAAVIAYLASRPQARAPDVTRQLAAQRRQEAAARLEQLDHQLAEMLDAAGAGALADATQRAHAYLTACQNHERWIEARAELGDVRTEIAAVSQPIGDLERIERRMADLTGCVD